MSELRDLVSLFFAMSNHAENAYEEARETSATGEGEIEAQAMIRMNEFNKTCNRLAAEIRAADPTFNFMRVEEWLARCNGAK